MKKTLLFMICCAICFAAGSAGIYAEESLATDVIVDPVNHTVMFLYEDDWEGAFDDIPEDADYNMSVSYLKQIGMIRGTSFNQFQPDREVTRAEFVTMLQNLSGEQTNGITAELDYVDVPASAWYKPAVTWATTNEIVQGDQNGRFNATADVTKEEAIVMMDRLAQQDEGHLMDYVYEIEPETFVDFDQVSPWAEESVENMIAVGVLDKEETVLAVEDTVTRAEAAELLAMYHFLSDRPTILTPDSTPIEYIDPGEQVVVAAATTTSKGITDEDGCENLSTFVVTAGDAPPLVTDHDATSGAASPAWATDNHASMLNRSFALLAKDNNNYKTPVHVSNLSIPGQEYLYFNGKLSFNARKKISKGSMAPDEILYDKPEDETDNGQFFRHYYKFHPDLKKGIGTSKDYDKPISTTRNAYIWFNNHYYTAKTRYDNKQYLAAYESLGRSIHYLEDINAPHHARLVKNTKQNNNEHKRYESWVKNDFRNEYWEHGTAKDSYPFMKNSSFRYMSNSFSKNAYEKYPQCKLFDSKPTVARTATADLTKRTQRAVAGILYRFLADTGRAK